MQVHESIAILHGALSIPHLRSSLRPGRRKGRGYQSENQEESGITPQQLGQHGLDEESLSYEKSPATVGSLEIVWQV